MKSFETFFTLCSPEDDSNFTNDSNWGMDEDENSEEGDVEEEEQNDESGDKSSWRHFYWVLYGNK